MSSGEDLEFLPTEDGSLTCRDPNTGELYHNRAGAFTEALKNYYEPSAAWRTLSEEGDLLLLDACFGLGYNSLVLVSELVKSGASGQLSIVAVEIDPRIFAHLPNAFPSAAYIRSAGVSPAFAPIEKVVRAIGNGAGHYEISLGDLSLKVDIYCDDLRKTIKTLQGDFDLVFHDPFSPRSAPELWTKDLFDHYFRLTQPRGGQVLTYSASPSVRNAFFEAGFSVWKTAVVGSKRGGSLAFHETRKPRGIGVEQLSSSDLEKLSGPNSRPYRDPDLSAPREAVTKSL